MRRLHWIVFAFVVITNLSLLAYAQTVTISTTNQTGGTTAAVVNYPAAVNYPVVPIATFTLDGGVLSAHPIYLHDNMPMIGGDDDIIWFTPSKCSHADAPHPDGGAVVEFAAHGPREPACVKYRIYPALVDGGVVWKCIGDCR
jgi:hypothetical protein